MTLLSTGAAGSPGLNGVSSARHHLTVIHQLPILINMTIRTVIDLTVSKVPIIDPGGGVVALAPVVEQFRGEAGETQVLRDPLVAVPSLFERLQPL